MTKLSIFIVTLLTISSCSFSYTRPKKLTSETRTVDYNYDQLLVSNAIDIIYIPDSIDNISVSAEADELKKISIENNHGTLTIKRASHLFSMNNSSNVTVTIHHSHLKDVSLSGASDFTNKDTLVSEHFTLKLSGASDAHIHIKAVDIESIISGASDATMAGYCKNLTLISSGASDFDGSHLNNLNTEVQISGASSAKVSTINTLKGNVSGASELVYKGNPTKDINPSGSSEIIQK